MNIWQFQENLTRRLSWWAVFNLVGGTALAWLSHPFWRGFGLQAAGWGLINGLIAFFGGSSARKRQLSLPDAQTSERQVIESHNLNRLLWFNTGLDVLYVLSGFWLVRSRGKADRSWRGHGWGIMLQGSFLFFFDLVHAALLSRRRQ